MEQKQKTLKLSLIHIFHLCSSKVKNFFCVHPFLRKLCYNSFDDLHLYAVIPVTIYCSDL